MGGSADRVGQQVDATEPVECGIDQPGRGVVIVGRAGHGHHGKPFGLQGALGVAELVLGASVDDHRCPFEGKTAGR